MSKPTMWNRNDISSRNNSSSSSSSTSIDKSLTTNCNSSCSATINNNNNNNNHVSNNANQINHRTIYGPAQLETHLHALLRQTVKHAKLNVYYPGRWMKSTCHGYFRVTLCGTSVVVDDDVVIVRQWKFRSNARIASMRIVSIHWDDDCPSSNVSGVHVGWETTEQEVSRHERVYDHVISNNFRLTEGGPERFKLILTVELDTLPLDCGDENAESTIDKQCDVFDGADEESHLYPPPCISVQTSTSDEPHQNTMQPVLWEWKPVQQDGDNIKTGWSPIYQCWTSNCPFETSECQSHLQHKSVQESTWVFPHQMSLCSTEMETAVEMSIPEYHQRSENNRLFDFSKEMFGKVKIIIHADAAPELVKASTKLFVGETQTEALSDDEEHFEQSTELEVSAENGNEVVLRSVHLLAFRYARVAIDGNTNLEGVKVECIARSPRVTLRCNFSTSSDSDDNSAVTSELDNRIWNVASYTLQQCLHHNFIVDGIKRDRLPWAGDLAVSIMANAYSFADAESVRCTLVVLGRCGIDKLMQTIGADETNRNHSEHKLLLKESHVNGIVDFSLWYFISHWLYQRYFGDATFLRQEWPTIQLRLSALIRYCTDANTGYLDTSEDDWIFIDWTDNVEKNKALQILWWWALDCGLSLVNIMNSQKYDTPVSGNEKLSNVLRETQSRLETSFIKEACIQEAYSRHAHIFGVLSGLYSRLVDNVSGTEWWNPDTSDDHWHTMVRVRMLDEKSRDVLLGDELGQVGTPFMKHLECLAISRLGERSKSLDIVRRYWEGMLDSGATTFYEAFADGESVSDIPQFYDRPYARSLCHAWGSGPCALLPELLLGLRPLANGWKVFACDPLEECPSNVSAFIQTKDGVIEVHLDPSILRVVVPTDTTMILMERTYGTGEHVIPRAQLLSVESIRRWSQKYRNWQHHPEYVIPPNPVIKGYEDVTMTDVPTVYQLPDDSSTYYMSFIAFNGTCYQSFVTKSTDLMNWSGYRLAMSAEGIDEGGVVLGAYLYESYDIDRPRVLKRMNSRFYSLYGAYSRKGGYEIDPGHQGLASSDDGVVWKREGEEHILSIFGPDNVGKWEQSSIYQPWLMEHKGTYYNFYNAKQMPQWIEQIGLATSTNLHEWRRHKNNPVLCVSNGGFDKQFCADPKVFYDNDAKRWVMFYFGVGKGGAHIMIAYSNDLIDWIRDPVPLYYSGDNPSGLDKSYCHKISIVYAKEKWYMHYCAVGDSGRGIGMITSK